MTLNKAVMLFFFQAFIFLELCPPSLPPSLPRPSLRQAASSPFAQTWCPSVDPPPDLVVTRTPSLRPADGTVWTRALWTAAAVSNSERNRRVTASRMNGSAAVTGGPASCRFAHYFVVCGVDTETGLEPDDGAGTSVREGVTMVSVRAFTHTPIVLYRSFLRIFFLLSFMSDENILPH